MQRKSSLLLILLVILAACQSSPSGDQERSARPSAYIENKGSDTMVNLALVWAERYREHHPEVQISVTGGGSGTGLAALINGTVDIANASRRIKPEELEQAHQAGYEAFEFVVASDAVAVIVHPDNPVNQLTLEQIARIYKAEINNWAELGGEDRPIVRVSRETNSGTHVYFLEAVIRLGDSKDKSIFSADTLLLPSSEGIIAEVRDNQNAIGYDGLGYITPEVKVISVAVEAEGEYIYPSVATVLNDQYPISRDLYMYTHAEPQGALKDYIDWIFGEEAQAIVRELGFVPINLLQSRAYAE